MAINQISLAFSINQSINLLVRGDPFLLAPARLEWAHYLMPKAPETEQFFDVIVEVNSPLESNVIKNSSSFSGSHLIASWSGEVSPLDARPFRLSIQANRAARFIVAKWLIEPAIRFAAQQKGILMTHAAALSDGERAILVSGSGGSGKTTWALNWLSAHHPYLSDDFSFIMAGQVHPYITPLRLGLKNVLSSPVLRNMSVSDKLETAARTALRQVTLGRAKFYFKAPITRLIPGISISKPVELIGALYIDSTTGARASVDPTEMAATMTNVDLSELHGFGPPSLRSAYSETHFSQLTQLLSSKPCFRLPPLLLPHPPSLSSISELLNWASGS